MKQDKLCTRSQKFGAYRVWQLRLLPYLIMHAFTASSLYANPLNPTVINGSASFSQQSNVLSVTNSPGTILNWHDFSVQAGEVTRFIQRDSSSAVLNRVIGRNPSTILGRIESNGRVFLINPNGILMGQGARIDVNAWIASTLPMTNEDFLAGRMRFSGDKNAGMIQQLGGINTDAHGAVYLIAPNVEQSGVIYSPQGEVILAAGHQVELLEAHHPDVRVVVSAPDHSAINLGKIMAEGGSIGIYASLIKQQGIVSANSAVVGAHGNIIFKAGREAVLGENSQSSATGMDQGGSIQLLGDHVGMASGSHIDVSAHQGRGGTVKIGGDFHGQKSAVTPHASRSYIDSSATVQADALEQGDGGSIVVWSDELTRVSGQFSAQGGRKGGAGGIVELSSQGVLDFRAKVNVGAQNGHAGQLWLDPANVTLMGGSGDGGTPSDGSTAFKGSLLGGVNFSDPDLSMLNGSIIYQSELEGLSPGTMITIEASDGIRAAGTFANRITLPMNSSLTLRTRNALTDGKTGIGIDLTTSQDASNLEIKAQGNGNVLIQTGAPSIIAQAAQNAPIHVGKISTNGGSVTIDASGDVSVRSIKTTPLVSTYPVIPNSPSISTQAGNIAIQAKNGSVLIGDGGLDARGNGAGSPSGDVSVSAGAGGHVSLQDNDAMISAHQLRINSDAGIYGVSATDALNTQVDTLNLTNQQSGPIRVSNTGTYLSIADTVAQGGGIRQSAIGQDVSIVNASAWGVSIDQSILLEGGSFTLNAPAGINISPNVFISTKGGAANLMAVDSDAMINVASGAGINTGNGILFVHADKMALAGHMTAGAGVVSLSPNFGTNIALGAGSSDQRSKTLELSVAELNTISAATLRVGDNQAGTIEIQSSLDSGLGGALQGIRENLSLTSGSAISQLPSATIGGISSVAIKGAKVALMEANPTGLIAGESTQGDFNYRSSNLLTATSVDGINGISAGATGNIHLVSDSLSGINQMLSHPIVVQGGSLILQTPGSVELTDIDNKISAISADLTYAQAGQGSLNIYSSSDMSVSGDLSAIHGISSNQKEIRLSVAEGKSLNVNSPIQAGMGSVDMSADQISVNQAITAADIHLSPSSIGRAITIGSKTCFVSPCLTITDMKNMHASTVAIGQDGSDMKPSGDIYVAAVTSGMNPITDHSAVTTRLGLLSSGRVFQEGIIDIQDLGVLADKGVMLNAANHITNISAVTQGGAFHFENAKGFHVKTLASDNVSVVLSAAVDDGYKVDGINSHGGDITLLSHKGDIQISSPVLAGAGNVNLKAGIASQQQDILVIDGSVASSPSAGVLLATTGAMTLKATGAITISGSVNGNVTQQANLNAPIPTPVEATPVITPAPATSTVLQKTIDPTLQAMDLNSGLVKLAPPTPKLGAQLPQDHNSPPQASDPASAPQASNQPHMDDKPINDKPENDKDNKEKAAHQDANQPKDNGAKKNDVAKKMYCN